MIRVWPGLKKKEVLERKMPHSDKRLCPDWLGIGRTEGEKNTMREEATQRSVINSGNFFYKTKSGNYISVEHLNYERALILEPVVGI